MLCLDEVNFAMNCRNVILTEQSMAIDRRSKRDRRMPDYGNCLCKKNRISLDTDKRIHCARIAP
jgi:hypothetical protein